jgi:hypothetical protein
MDTATLLGNVFDSSGKVIAGARIELVDLDHSTRQYSQTNRSGIYVFPNTKPGHYRLTVSAAGYTTATLPQITIYVQDDIQQNFRMTSGSPLESVTIQANGTPLETTGAVVTVVEQHLVNELPLNGRSFQTLFQLTPGVVIAPTNFASQGQFSVNGQRTDTNYFTIDGVSANLGIAAGVTPGQTAGGSLPALTTFGGTNGLVSTDDVQEFAVLTSGYSAEFGRMPGGQISVVTRSGTNEFHGKISDYLRNDAFDANDWFANKDNLKRAILRQNDYSLVVGGPLQRDTTFVFLSYEGLQLRQPSSEETDVPSLTVRRSAPIILQSILNAYPLPNGPEEGNGLARATYSFSNPSNLNTGSVRVDHHLSDFVSVFARYDQSASDHQERGAALDSLSTVTDSRFGLRTLTGAITYRISSRWMNDLRVNWSESSTASNDHLDNLGGAIPLLPGIAVSSFSDPQHGLFQFISGINARHGEVSVGSNAENSQRQLNVVDNTSLQDGNHLLRFGFDFRRLWPKIMPSNYQQQDVFTDPLSALDGRASFALVGNVVAVDSRFSNYSAYIQDTWRPSDRLSLTSGVRWDYNSAPHGRGTNGMRPVALENIDTLPTFSIAPQGTPLYRAPFNNVAPRFGIAYTVRNLPGTETVIQAGVGRFYDLADVSAGDSVGAGVFPFSAKRILIDEPFPLSPADAQPPELSLATGPLSTILAFPEVLKLPETWQWNISIQQSLRNQQLLTMSYIGSIGLRLLRTEEYLGDGTTDFAELRLTTNNAYSRYDSFQVRFQRRWITGPHILAFYALSHSLDNSSTESVFNVLNGIPSRFLDPHTDYGSSDFDIRHIATIGLDYDFPAVNGFTGLKQVLSNWSVDSIALFRSAPPVNVTISRDIGFGQYDFRPDLVNDVSLYVHDPTAPGGRAINPAAVSIPAAQRQGTLGRNFFRGFSLVQTDLSLRRQFHVSEHVRLQARVEAFNLFNRPNFGLVDGKLGILDNAGAFFAERGFGLAQTTLGRGLQGSSVAKFGSGFSPLYQIGSARSLQMVLKVEF